MHDTFQHTFLYIFLAAGDSCKTLISVELTYIWQSKRVEIMAIEIEGLLSIQFLSDLFQ